MNPERIGRFVRKVSENIVPDVLENIPISAELPTVECGLERPEDAMSLTERFFQYEGRELREELKAHTEQLPIGLSRARIVVGSQEEGTRHPHDFYVDKEDEAFTLYFVDPEHQMGKSQSRSKLPRKGDIRPKIANLIAARFRGEDKVPEMNILRFRANNVEDGHKLKMRQQFDAVRELLATNEVPDFLKGIERDITFKLNVRPDRMQVASRGATSEQLEEFLHGEADTPTLRGKLDAYSQIMQHFVRHLEKGRFSPFELPEERD